MVVRKKIAEKKDGISAKDHIMNWVYGVTRPEASVEWFKNNKPGFGVGLKSAVILGILIGVLNCIRALLDDTNIIESVLMIVFYTLMMPVVTLVFAGLMKATSALMKGKGTYSEHVGIVGMFLGMLTVASIPFAIAGLVFALTMVVLVSMASELTMVGLISVVVGMIALLLLIIGAGITLALTMLLFAEACTVVKENEKVNMITAVSMLFVVAIFILMLLFVGISFATIIWAATM